MDTDSKLPATRGRAFTRENLERGENRINVTIFTALAISEFRFAFCRLLGLSDDAQFKREVIPGRQLRTGLPVRGRRVERVHRDRAGRPGQQAKPEL